MNKNILFFIAVIYSSFSNAQFNKHVQYFDGADTTAAYSILIKMDPSPGNIWQVGKPQKTLFKKASTLPNAMVTDTLNAYPANNISRFSCNLNPPYFPGVLAMQWMQKLDMESNGDGGIVEFSVNSTGVWYNAFTSPYVYNFFGYNSGNKVTLLSGEQAFSGRDTMWRNVWLCIQTSWLNTNTDTLKFRFTFKSDLTGTLGEEGWMIDNMVLDATIHHTAKGFSDQVEYLKVYPAATDGRIHIEAQKQQQYHVIESIEVIGLDGRMMKKYGKSPTRFFIDINELDNGMYYVRVTTNLRSETFPVVLTK
jgi:hypothetical protein